MISFQLLDKDDLKVMIGCFNDGFLREPLLRPAKTLQKYIPNGFRPNKLKQNQVEKIYVDALSSGEPSINTYVTTNIEKMFDRARIQRIIDQIDDPGSLDAVAIADTKIASSLWGNHIKMPAYIPLLLNGIECPEKIKKISLEAFDVFFETIEETSEASFNAGLEKGKQAGENALISEQKAVARLKKTINEAHKTKEKIENEKKDVIKANEALQTDLAVVEKSLQEKEELIERIEKQNRQLEHELSQKKELEKKKEELISIIAELKDENKEKEEHIAQLLADLEKAKEEAYSEEVIKIICDDVIDEIQASTISQAEVLQIAKGKFSDSDTIFDSWSTMSAEADVDIKRIIEDLEKNAASEVHLDLIESIEDNELIKFAVIKALRAVLYNTLERKERNRNLSDRFEGDTTNEE